MDEAAGKIHDIFETISVLALRKADLTFSAEASMRTRNLVCVALGWGTLSMKLVTRSATPQHLTPWEGPGGDRRWTTVGFLEVCSPAIAEIYAYWSRKR